MSPVAMCIRVRGARVFRDGEILRVSGDSSLREVLQEVQFSDRVDDVLMQRAKCDDRHFLQR